ncbi:MAG: hypothetical protein HY864_05565 [Chloroflexi bacterium]|nr:hypothetical protein [Chloroflexota bacterium]
MSDMIAHMVQTQHFSKYFLAFFMVVSAGLGLLRFDSLQLGASYDDAHYIILAESLSSGQGYQLINFPNPQIERAFPPGWPLMLAPLTFFFPGDYSALKIFTLILWLATLPLIYSLFAKRIESPHLEILIGLTALNPLLVGTSVTVMSESAYLFFSMIVLVLFDSQNSEKRNYRLIILVAIAALFTQLIRTVGISIFIALLLYYLFSRKFREAGITFGVLALGALIQFWLNLRNGGSVISAGYESQVFSGSILEKIGQMWSNLLGYLNETAAGSLIPIFGEKVTTLVGPVTPLVINAVILLLIVSGLLLLRKKLSLMDVYVLIYLLGVLAFWNPKVGSVKARFLIPIIPFLYFYLIQGLKWIFERFSKNSARFVIGAAGLIAIVLLARNLQDWRSPVSGQMTDLSIGAGWVAENAPADAIIMVNEPVPAYVQMRRQTVGYPKDLQNIEKYIINQGIDFIIVAPELQSPRSTNLDEDVVKELLPILNGSPEKFTVVYHNSEYNVTVYRFEN